MFKYIHSWWQHPARFQLRRCRKVSLLAWRYVRWCVWLRPVAVVAHRGRHFRQVSGEWGPSLLIPVPVSPGVPCSCPDSAPPPVMVSNCTQTTGGRSRGYAVQDIGHWPGRVRCTICCVLGDVYWWVRSPAPHNPYAWFLWRFICVQYVVDLSSCTNVASLALVLGNICIHFS